MRFSSMMRLCNSTEHGGCHIDCNSELCKNIETRGTHIDGKPDAVVLVVRHERVIGDRAAEAHKDGTHLADVVVQRARPRRQPPGQDGRCQHQRRQQVRQYVACEPDGQQC